MKFTFLLAILDDKNHDAFLQRISKFAERIIITKAPSERSSSTEKLADAARNYIDNVEIIEDYKTAYELVLNNSEPTCITGSIYLIGAIKNLAA